MQFTSVLLLFISLFHAIYKCAFIMLSSHIYFVFNYSMNDTSIRIQCVPLVVPEDPSTNFCPTLHFLSQFIDQLFSLRIKTSSSMENPGNVLGLSDISSSVESAEFRLVMRFVA